MAGESSRASAWKALTASLGWEIVSAWSANTKVVDGNRRDCEDKRERKEERSFGWSAGVVKRMSLRACPSQRAVPREYWRSQKRSQTSYNVRSRYRGVENPTMAPSAGRNRGHKVWW